MKLSSSWLFLANIRVLTFNREENLVLSHDLLSVSSLSDHNFRPLSIEHVVQSLEQLMSLNVSLDSELDLSSLTLVEFSAVDSLSLDVTEDVFL